MASFNDTGYGSITLSATVTVGARLTTAGALASATQQHVGFATVDGVSGDGISYAFANKQGTVKAIAAGAYSAGAKVYTAASGKVSTTQATGAFLAGILMAATAADGDVCEVMPIVGDTAGA